MLKFSEPQNGGPNPCMNEFQLTDANSSNAMLMSTQPTKCFISKDVWWDSCKVLHNHHHHYDTHAEGFVFLHDQYPTQSPSKVKPHYHCTEYKIM